MAGTRTLNERDRTNVIKFFTALNDIPEDDVEQDLIINYINFKKVLEGIGYEVRKANYT